MSKATNVINLAAREVNVTNLNFSPERHGEEKVARVDLSLEVILEPDDVAQFLITDRVPDMLDGAAIHQIWDDQGIPRLTGAGKIHSGAISEGFCRLSRVGSKKLIEFENAVLSKVTLELMTAWKCRMWVKVRLDPTGQLDLLETLTLKGVGVFAFSGVTPTKKEGDDGQQQLAV